MLPQVNAQVISITTPGFSEDYDRPAGTSGPNLLDEPCDAYYQEQVVTSFSQSGGALSKNKDVKLIIPADITELPSDQIKTGYIVTYIYRGATHARRIMDTVDKFLDGIPNPTIKLHLDPAPVDVEELV